MERLGAMDTINIFVNDDSCSVPSCWTIRDLVLSFYPDWTFIVVQYNQKIIEKKEDYEHIHLNTDDKIELITFMGGGSGNPLPAHSERLHLFNRVDVYPVLGPECLEPSLFFDCVHSLLQAGCHIIQLRDKTLSDSELLQCALTLRTLTRRYNALLIINDRADICLACQADGIHIGQDDIPLVQARKILGPDYLIGVSTHSLNEALDAEKNGADSINIGPIFPTQTKPNFSYLGLDCLSLISSHISLPFSVMGGIHPHNIQSVLDRGAHKIGMISALLKNNDFYNNAHHLKSIIRQHS